MDGPPHGCDELKNSSASGEGKRLLISEQRLNHKMLRSGERKV